MRISPKVELFFIVIFLSIFNNSCATAEQKVDKPLVQPDYRLQEDRKAFEEVRSQVPEEKRIENDELAYIENLFENPLEKPAKIRDRFYKLLAKKRIKFSKDLTKRREAYVKEERKNREQFTKDIEAQRNEFKRRKTTTDERKEFFSDIELKRKDFYANQKEKRDDFEAQMRDDRKNFEDYAREKTNDFNARHREFSEKQRNILKEKKDGSTNTSH
jgi:hypothetical protein